MTLNNSDILRPPFPPNVNVEDFVNNEDLRNNLRSPNAFFIYRKSYTRHLLQLNHRLPMTQVSKMASIHWSSEPRRVKKVYRQMAREVDRELNQRRQRNPHHPIIFSIITPSNAASILRSSGSSTNAPTHPRPESNLNVINNNVHNSQRFANATIIDPFVTLAPAPPDYTLGSDSEFESWSENDFYDSLPSNVLSEIYDQDRLDGWMLTFGLGIFRET